jgi:hypothetical protein
LSPSRLLRQFTDSEKRLLRQFSWPLEKIRPFSRLLAGRHRHAGVEKMFFSFEQLPAFGKEYWFIYFVDPASGRHLICMFGRGQGTVNIARSVLESPDELPPGAVLPLVGLYWSFSDGRKRFGKFKSAFRASYGAPNRLSDSHGHIELSGAYPRYSFVLREKGRVVCRLRLSRGRGGIPFELGHFDTGLFGFELVNLFLRASGRLNGRPFSGDAYVQKVVVVGPFVPWNWTRVYFPDGSNFDFFQLRFSPNRSWGSITPSQAAFWDARRRKFRHFRNLSIERERGSKAWVVRDGNQRVLLHLFPRAKHGFLFQSKGEFHYDQYLVDAVAEDDGMALAGRRLEKGAGLVEDAYGFML